MADEEFRDGQEQSPNEGVPPPSAKSAKSPKGNGAEPPKPESRTREGEGASGAKAYKPPPDAVDLAGAFVDMGQGDPLTETVIHSIPVDKPKDFFRVHPDPAYRRRCFVYTLKTEGQVEEHHCIVTESMRDLVPEAKLCLIAVCIYRNGAPRLWLLKLPKEGEKDQNAWITARAAARNALTKWTKIVWVGNGYQTREAEDGYAPEPDWTKLPSFERMVELAFGAHGIIRDESHPIYRDHVIGASKKKSDDDFDA
jgi:hypothetical protein